jgi:hypothetical protein
MMDGWMMDGWREGMQCDAINGNGIGMFGGGTIIIKDREIFALEGGFELLECSWIESGAMSLLDR